MSLSKRSNEGLAELSTHDPPSDDAFCMDPAVSKYCVSSPYSEVPPTSRMYLKITGPYEGLMKNPAGCQNMAKLVEPLRSTGPPWYVRFRIPSTCGSVAILSLLKSIPDSSRGPEIGARCATARHSTAADAAKLTNNGLRNAMWITKCRRCG